MDITNTTATRKRPSGFIKEIITNKVLYAFFLPGMILMLMFNYMPMFGIIIAFKDVNFRDGIFGSPWVGFKNFEFLFNGPDAFNITRNTIGYNLIFTILGVIIPVFFAITLNEIRGRRLAKFYQSSLFLPYFLSWVIVAYMVYALLNSQYGFINNTLFKLLGKEGLDWYSESAYWPFIFIFFNIWKYSGYGTVIYLAAITAIDPEYYEAASIDGAEKWQQIKHITIPFLKPMIIILTILSIGRIFTADFGMFFNLPLQSGILQPVTNVIDVYVYNTFMLTRDIGMSSAAGLYQSVMGFILIIISNYIVKKIDSENGIF